MPESRSCGLSDSVRGHPTVSRRVEGDAVRAFEIRVRFEDAIEA